LLINAMDQLAGLTALRDRDQFDLALAHALAQVFGASEVALHWLVADAHGCEHWWMAGAWRQGQLIPPTPGWTDSASLPGVDDFPLRLQAIEEQLYLQVQETPGCADDGWLTVIPLVRQGCPCGVVELHTAAPLSMAHVQSLESFLKVVRNHQGLLDASQTDPLTGLLNRQTFDTTFLSTTMPPPAMPHGHVSTSQDRRLALENTWWMAVIDIDHFKLVNDRFGHLMGDEVLVLVARLMKQTFRSYDRLFRFGGEEFVVMLRCPNEESAKVALERFRTRMEAYRFPQVGQVTVSIGFTEVFKSDGPSAAFARADEAVYQAKHQGRNLVLSHESLLAQGIVEVASHDGGVELF
jgi:diguanylate cyclase (GGDEF)-like protein